MFEGQLAYYLNRYLGSYVYGLDPQSLKVSVFSGDVVLTNLQLKPSALADLNLPVSVKSGLLGKLTLKVPWRSLGRTPVVVEMDRLFILAGPKQEEAEELDLDEEDDVVEQLVKNRRIEAAEASWNASAAKLDDAGDSGKPGRFQAIIDTVIGNIQLSISNIHVRFEDDVSNPDMPFAVGFTLERLSAQTVDEDGKPAFVTNNPMELLRKASELRRLALYFDVGAALWQTDADWRDMQPGQWDELFMPSISAPADGQQAPAHTYVLKPLDGRTTYLRRGPKARESEAQAVQQADVGLEAVSLHVTRPQYVSVHSLLDELSAFSARRPNAHLRPRSRPKSGPAARRWWKYAIRVAVQKTRSQFIPWSQITKVVHARRRYVPLYVRCLQANMQGGDDEIHELDRQLPEATILTFRCLAHAQVEREKRRLAAIAAAEAKARQQQSWLGWLTGATPKVQAPEGDELGLRGDFSPEEAAKLQELVDEREHAIKAAYDSPHSLQMQVQVHMASGAIVLDGEAGAHPVLRAGTRSTTTVVRMYPKTMRIATSVAGMGIVTPDGMIVRSGALLPPATSLLREGEPHAEADEQASSDKNALEVECITSPQDGSADTIVKLALAPSYITYHAATVQRLMDFFHTEQEVDLSALGAQAIAQVENARRQAAAQLAAAMQNKPKLALHAQLDGPKIAIPVPATQDGRGKVALVLDLGSCVIETDTALAASLPSDEAALYECVKLQIKDVSAYAVDGEFSFQALEEASAAKNEQPAALVSHSMAEAVQEDDGQALGGAALFIPLLQRCGTEASVQAARFADPERPALRAGLSVPGLRFHLSPGRVRRIMRVIQAAVPGGDKTGQAAQAPVQQPWRVEPDAAAKPKLLEWGGIARASASWQKRWVYLYRGRVYVLESKSASQELASHNIWLNRRIVRVPQSVVGVPYVIAVCPEDLDIAKVPEDTDSVLLRFTSSNEADAWLHHLNRSQQAMRQLVGTGAEDAGRDDSGEASGSASGASPTGDHATGSMQVKVDVNVQLGEVALFVSGRCAEVWWPAEESLAETGERPLISPQADIIGRSSDIVNVDNELSLIVVRASGGSATAQVADAHISARVAVGAFEIEDLLVGSRCSALGYLARSFEAEDQSEEEKFVDASSSLKTLSRSSVDSAKSETFQDAPGPSELSPQPNTGAWLMDFDSWKPDGPEYNNVDSQLHMRLTTLYFFCNRPTIGALMAFGTDLGDAFKTDSADEQEESEGRDEDRPLQAAESSASEADYEPETLVRKGGEDRTTFRLTMEVRRLQATLSYESSDAAALALASIEDVHIGLAIHPSTLSVSAELGNLRAQDATLAEDHPYRNICSVRQDAATSLIELQFEMLSPAEAARNKLVPDGLPFCRLQAQMRELQVVFLSRFVFEVLRYITLMLKLRPEPLQDDVQAAGAATTKPVQASEGAAPFILQLDLHMDAPVITMPRFSDSRDNVRVDLGAVRMSNVVAWHAGSSPADPQAVLVEEDVVQLSDLRAEVMAEGHQGANIIREFDDGMRLRLQRPLLDRHHTLPATGVSMDLPSIKATLSDREYTLIVSMAGDNFGEEQRVPSGAVWLEETLQAQEEQDKGSGGGDPEEQQSLAERTGNMAKTLYFGKDPPASAPQQQQLQPAQSGKVPSSPSGSDGTDPIAIRVAINIGKSELELQRTANQATGALTPLARFTVRNLWVAFTSTQGKALGLQLSLPWVEGQDMRPWVPQEHALVISSADSASDAARAPASLLTMQWAATAELAHQTLQMRLQRPTVSAEMSFMLAVAKFFIPGFALGGITPTPFQSYDTLLSGEHRAEGDVWLSPESRLLADVPSSPEDIVYDGCGHRIVLPQDVAMDDPLPLLLVGTGKTLILRNVRIVHASSLPACLQLAPGAQLVARPEDHVDMLQGIDPDIEGRADRAHFYARNTSLYGWAALPDRSRLAAALGSAARGFSGSFMRPVSQQLARPSQSQSLAQRSPATATRSSAESPPSKKVDSVIEMNVAAVGVALRFLELEASAQEGEATLSRKHIDGAQPHAQGQTLRMLAAYLDASMHARMASEQQKFQAQLRGLRLETQVDLGHHGGQDMPESGRVQGTVLEPCAVDASVTMRMDGPGDCAVTLSDVRMNLSADLLELAQSLQQTVIAPLAAPAADRPLAMCSRFVRQWASQPTVAGAAGAVVITHVLGEDRGLTFWRPQPPLGYAIVGDCAVAGSAQPTFQVVALAVNSGFVTYPKAYTKAHASHGVTVWRATPPEGFVALGCLVTSAGDGSEEAEPPSLTDMVCVHASIGTSAPLGQCLDLHLTADGQERKTAGSMLVWCIDNAMASFDVCSASDGTPSGPLLDLRSPLGISPIALSQSAPTPAAKPSPQAKARQDMLAGQKSYRSFQTARDALMRSSTQRRQRAQAVDFRRVWWDRGARNATRAGLSIWRPVPPAGYVALGDCLGNGHDPPRSVTVLLECGDAGDSPLLRPADDLDLVWRDETAVADKCLCLWRPRAPARYAAMGLIASIGSRQPDPNLVRCVREGEVDSHETRGLSPSVVLQEAAPWTQGARRVRLALWLADERLGAFTATFGRPQAGEKDRPPPMLRLRLLNREEQLSQRSAAHAAGGGLNFVLKAGATSILVRDALRRPLAELELGSLQASLSRLSDSVSQAYLGVQVAVWSFNAPIGAWEPMLEPWNLILNGEINSSKQTDMGVTPGAHLHLKSASEMLRLTVAYAAAASFMRALLEWRDLHAAGAGDAYKRQLAAADASSLHTLVDNVLTVPAQLQLDFGNHISTADLQPGKATPVLQPLPKPPQRHSQRHALSDKALPPALLLVDMQRLLVTGAQSNAEWGKAELIATVCLQDAEEETARTRAVNPQGSSAEWAERLFLTLSTAAGKQGSVPVSVEVHDAAGNGGRGCKVASGVLSAPLSQWPDLSSQSVQLRLASGEEGRLEVAVACVQQWQVQPAGPSDAYLARGSTAGQRAMRIGGQGPWLWVPSTALQSAAGTQASKRSAGAVTSSVVPIRAQAVGGCALESSFRGGVKREVLRSLCQVHNATQLPLQVALATLPAASEWQEVPRQAGSGRQRRSSQSQAAQGPVEEELFENERYVLLRGWSGSHLLPTERRRFSRDRQSFGEFPRIPAPAGWEWDGQWEVERQGHVDKDGWAYFADFTTSRYPPPAGAQKRSLIDFVRRRRIVRRRKPVGAPELETDGQHAQQQQQQAQREPEVEREIVGVVEPGDSLPLPYSWRSNGKQVQVRPILAGQQESVHAWSTCPSHSDRPIDLQALDEAQSCLATCRPASRRSSQGGGSLMDAEPGSGGMTTSLAAAPTAFSVTVEGDLLADSDSAPAASEPLTDWRLVVAPTLVLQNLLPIRGSFLVWERPQGGSNLVLRQSGQVESGEQAHIYGSSVQQPVSLQFYPDGYDWAEAEPVPLWHGTSSDQAGTRGSELPDRFRIAPHSHSSSSQLILMDREVNMDSWVLENNEALRNPGTAIAAGLPLVVRLLVPLWVVNATMLPIGVGIADVGAPSQPKAPEPGNFQRGKLDTDAIKMKVLEANVPLRQQLRDVRQVMANTVAMIGYPLPQLQVLSAQQSQQHYGVRLKVGDSGWTAPMPLESGAQGEGTEQLNTRPVLVRAKIPSWGTMHEVVARLDLVGGGFARTMALRLEPHHVISNHTGIPLQLMHYQPGSMRETYERKAGGAVEVGRGGTTPSGLPRASPSGPSGQPGLKGAAHEADVDWTSVLELPTGASGVPLAWSLQSQERAVCMRLKPEAKQDSPTLWSIPVGIDTSEGGLRHVPVPVKAPQRPQGSYEEGEQAGPSYRRRIETMLTAAGPAWQLEGPRVARRIKHLSLRDEGSMGGPADMQDTEAVILRFRATLRSPGSIHIILESISAKPPFMLENRSAYGCQYRQAALTQVPFQQLPPWSAAGFAWQTSQQDRERPDKVEFQDTTGGGSVTYQLDAADARTLAGDSATGLPLAGAGALSQLPPLAVGSARLQAAVQQHDQEVMIGAGLRSIGGGANLGRAHPYRTLWLSPGEGTAFNVGQGSFSAGSGKARGEETAGMPVYAVIEVTALEVSLVDHTPEELLAATLIGLRLEYAAGLGPESDFVSLRLSLDSAQLDDEQATTRFPVVLRPAPLEDEGQGEVQPLVQLTTVMQMQGPGGQPHYPFLSFRVSRPLLVAVSETMVWRTVAMLERLDLAALSPPDDGQAVSTASDMPVAISLAAVSDLAASVSFRGDQTARPRRVANQMGALAWGLDMANFENVPVQLQGFEIANQSMLWSVFINEGVRIIKGQLVGVALSFLRNFAVLKGASGALGVLSAGVGSLTGDELGQRERQEARAERDISGVGQGLVEGGTALGQGFLRGVTGLVSKPLQGAAAGGASGFVKGVTQGIVGVAANPISGALDFMSSAFEGMDATSAALLRRARAAEAQRARLPRAIAGDRRLLAFQRPDGSGMLSDKQARIEAVGQALLRRCQEGGVSLGLGLHVRGRRAQVAADAYEEHFVLHGDAVALLTNRRLLCLRAPGFAPVQGRAEASGAPVPMSSIPVAELAWGVEWQDVLDLELKDTHKDGRPPNRLVVHRRGVRPAQGDQDSLTYELHCTSRTSQAEQLKAVALRVRDKFTTTPADTSVWARRHAQSTSESGGPADSDLPPQQLPATMPSLDYDLVWRSDRDKDGNTVSIWRPVGPPGFHAVGDVAVAGYAKPTEPVQVLRDDSVLSQSALRGQPARTAPAAEFHLVWREPGADGATLWEPVPPRGYRSLGACASGSATSPPARAALCVREDATTRAGLYDSPLWRVDPPALQGGLALQRTQSYSPDSWKCSLWPIDGPSRTFIAVRSLHRPPGDDIFSAKL